MIPVDGLLGWLVLLADRSLAGACLPVTE